MINPYENIDWSSAKHIMSCSHEHCENQTQFNRLTSSSGLQHFAISNYYPSDPVYPLSSKIEYGIPEDAISCPNAEHHNVSIDGVKNGRLHINGLGSFYSSGSARGETPFGCEGKSVLTIINEILQQLQFSDGGGVTINHPFWTGLTVDNIKQMLDYDSRVLGLEIFNSYSEHYTDGVLDESMVENIKLWDAILMTGRRCWGFCVADHQGQQFPDWQGRNMLLVETADEHSCLKAYRNGEFYGKLKNTPLKFDNVVLNGNTYTVESSLAETIDIIIDGIKTEYTGTSINVSVPSGATYIRAEAHNSEDSIFTNPIILKEYTPSKNSMTNNILLYM